MTSVVREQGQGEEAALPVLAQILAGGRADARVVEAAHADRAARLEGEPVAGPVGEAELLAHPGRVVEAVDGGGDADHLLRAGEPVDVAVGDREGGAQAPRRRLEDLGGLEAGGEVAAGLIEQLVALLECPRLQGRGRAFGGPPSRSTRSRSAARKRRCPPGVRLQAILPLAAQRRMVLALTSSRSAACCTRSQRGPVSFVLTDSSIGPWS